MKKNTFLVLGGYGNTGRIIVRLLLEHTNANIIIAGRNFEKAKQVAARFNLEYNTDRVTWVKADAADESNLYRAFKQCGFVIVASSTSNYTGEIASAAIQNSIDYLDVQFSPNQAATLDALKHLIRSYNLCFITDAGFHPGLPAALVRYASKYFDEILTANVASLIRFNWKKYSYSRSTILELLDEMRMHENLMYRNGEWVRIKLIDKKAVKKFDFGEPFGKIETYLFHLEEMTMLPQTFPSLTTTGFYVSGFNWFVDYFVLPACYFTMQFLPETRKLFALMLEFGLKKFTKPPFKTCLKLEAEGLKDGKEKRVDIILSHEDGYQFTAIPVIACIMQYLSGGRKAGLFNMAYFVDPEKLLNDMKNLGITIEINEK